MQHNNYKFQRIESEILNIMNHTLKMQIYDEYIRKASFTAVKLTSDLSLAVVYVDTFNRDEIDHMVDKLTSAKGVFRDAIAHNLNTRKIPDIKFIRDTTIDNSLKIDKLLDKIN